jgi:hypothetical protein
VVLAIIYTLGYSQDIRREYSQVFLQLACDFPLASQQDPERNEKHQERDDRKVFYTFRFEDVIITESVHNI